MNSLKTNFSRNRDGVENRCCEKMGPGPIFRIIDANANRAREGLRVVEEISRFILENGELTSEWKKARHRITAILSELPDKSLIKERNSDSDVGKESYVQEEGERVDYREVALVNAGRAEEGVRVLEEFSKLVDPEIGKQLKKLRFDIYSLEKRTLSLL